MKLTATNGAINGSQVEANQNHAEIVIIGGGTAGLATAASILKRQPTADIIVIEPKSEHYYQAAWTLVGAGEYAQQDTVRPMRSVMPEKVRWLQQAVSQFEPEMNAVVLADGTRVTYSVLIVAPGIKLNWAAIEGLEETLGKHNVTSNYRYDLAPYTWELVKNFKGGNAIFTQPVMPIKCAGAPQKAMYLSCSHWQQRGILNQTRVDMYNAGGVLFGVADFVPPLMEYVKRYNINLNFNATLKKVDGPKQLAWFEIKNSDGSTELVERKFDLLHVVPPQSAPDFVAGSPLANSAGWVEVHHHTLQHVRYPNIFALGDVCSAPNAKTTAAVRKQAPIVAQNVLAYMYKQPIQPLYDGYGACPLTVEIGKVILAEFAYNGKLSPSFPLDPLKASHFKWQLKKNFFPWLYWNGALKGHEWLTDCQNDKKL